MEEVVAVEDRSRNEEGNAIADGERIEQRQEDERVLEGGGVDVRRRLVHSERLVVGGAPPEPVAENEDGGIMGAAAAGPDDPPPPYSSSYKGPFLGARHVFAFLGFLGFVNVYAMRVNLTVAIVAMVNNSAIVPPASNYSDDTCPMPANTTNTTKHDGTFDWDEEQQGQILGSFFYGYVCTQLIGGIMAEKLGGKWIFGLGILTTAVFTLLTPVAANSSFWLLIAVRVVEGFGEGVTYPCMHAMLAQWAPKMERSKLSAFIYAGAQMGTVISLPLSGLACNQLGWEAVFYIFGAVGVGWFLLWIVLIHDSPAKHPRISAEERAYIEESRTVFAVPPPIPWRAIATSPAVWGLLVAHVAQNWGFYTLLNDLPKYMSQILHFELEKDAYLSAVPHLAMWVMSVGGSIVADKLRDSGTLTTTKTRKLFNSIGFFGPAACLVGVAFAGCDQAAVIALLALTLGLSGLTAAGYGVNHIDIAPNFAGTLMGITNTASNFNGFITPVVVSAIIQERDDLTSWQSVFFIAAGVYLVVNFAFLIFGSGAEQPWNHVRGGDNDGDDTQSLLIDREDEADVDA